MNQIEFNVFDLHLNKNLNSIQVQGEHENR
jgi:hypothetical protein